MSLVGGNFSRRFSHLFLPTSLLKEFPYAKIYLDIDTGGDIDGLCALAILLPWLDIEITGITTMVEDVGRLYDYKKV